MFQKINAPSDARIALHIQYDFLSSFPQRKGQEKDCVKKAIAVTEGEKA